MGEYEGAAEGAERRVVVMGRAWRAMRAAKSILCGFFWGGGLVLGGGVLLGWLWWGLLVSLSRIKLSGAWTGIGTFSCEVFLWYESAFKS